ncbi:MAG: N-acetylmuramoyl-L-alanine amidase, partial [Lachnospiraceae bacterium]|nr:N-acetylmuramoyl-L-alanine amidase [Lachnospiraceae bacterium]
VVGQLSAESICGCFTSTSRQASCNYGIGTDGRVSLCVEEKNRSWCSSSNANDQRAVTIECASDKTEPYAMNDAVYATLIKLCTDICKRSGKKKLLWFADKDKTLNYSPASDEMVLTVHRWFANKSCPGNWLYARLGDLAAKVTAALGGSSQTTTGSTEMYRVRKIWADAKSQIGAYTVLANAKRKADENAGYMVFDSKGNAVYAGKTASTSAFSAYMVRVTISDLNIRKGPGTNYAKTGKYTGKGTFTIVAESDGQGATKWGKLKSGAGWISLDYASKI